MSIAPDTSKLDLPALSHKLAAADLGGCRHQLINEQLLDVRGWWQLPPDEIEARLKAEPLALLAAWELTDAVAHLNQATLSEKKFLKPFTSRKLLKRMAYLAFEVPTTELPQLPRTMLVTRSSVWDGLLFLHNVVRWALRFGALRKYDLRQFKQLNLRYPFAITIGAQPVDAVEAAIFTVLRELGIAWVEWDPQIAGHHLETWLCEHLAVNHDIEQKKQQRLEFREAGGTENSLFVVRAMGGVDGCLVRGQIERDLGLIIDIGDREVTKAATAYLEQHVVQILNSHTDLTAELVDGSLKLRWFDTRLNAEDLGQMIHRALREQLILKTISVNMIFDPLRIGSLRASILAYCDERETEIRNRSEEQAPFIICRSCQSYAPNAFCVVSVDRPPCCGRSYDELSTCAQLTATMKQLTTDKGICRDLTRGSYVGADKAAALFSHGTVDHVNLHSIRDYPHPSTAIPECIAYYLEDYDVICVLSADYSGRSPDGKTFDTLLGRVAGKQLSGFVAVSEAYLLSPRFLAAEGGLARVAWMNAELKKRLKLRVEHIATEQDCVNMAGLKEFLGSWRP